MCGGGYGGGYLLQARVYEGVGDWVMGRWGGRWDTRGSERLGVRGRWGTRGCGGVGEDRWGTVFDRVGPWASHCTAVLGHQGPGPAIVLLPLDIQDPIRSSVNPPLWTCSLPACAHPLQVACMEALATLVSVLSTSGSGAVVPMADVLQVSE